MSKENYLPGLQEASIPLSDDELAVLRKHYVGEGTFVSQQTKFNYAWGLVKSSKTEDQELGVKLLTEVFREAPNRRRECLYYLAIGSYKLHDYSNARKYTGILLDYEPENQQAKDLKKVIEDKFTKDGLVGLAIVGGAIALGVTAISSIMRRRR